MKCVALQVLNVLCQYHYIVTDCLLFVTHFSPKETKLIILIFKILSLKLCFLKNIFTVFAERDSMLT